jgi:hypothetical protein
MIVKCCGTTSRWKRLGMRRDLPSLVMIEQCSGQKREAAQLLVMPPIPKNECTGEKR